MTLDASSIKKYAPLIVVGVLVIVAFYFLSQNGAATQGTATVPGTNNSALNASIVSANAQEAATNASAAASQFNTEASLAATDEQDQVGLQEAQLAASAAASQVTAQQSLGEFSAAESSLSSMNGQDMQAYAQTSVAKSAATASFWQGLFGTVSVLGGAALGPGGIATNAAKGASAIPTFTVPASSASVADAPGMLTVPTSWLSSSLAQPPTYLNPGSTAPAPVLGGTVPGISDLWTV